MDEQLLTDIKEIKADIGYLLQTAQPLFPQTEPYLNTKQMLEYLNVSMNTLNKLRKNGLPVHTLPNSTHIRAKASELDKWIKDNNQ